MAISCDDLQADFEAARTRYNNWEGADCAKTTITDSAAGEKRDYEATRKSLLTAMDDAYDRYLKCIAQTPDTFVHIGVGAKTARSGRENS